MAVFGMTAKQWRANNPDLAKKGNIRDFVEISQLHVLTNIESLNSVLIERKVPKEKRFEILAQTAISQYRRIVDQEDLRRME
ncbi:MAG: hypothetical protein AAFQ83_04770 [Bacteroidota bacterium]